MPEAVAESRSGRVEEEEKECLWLARNGDRRLVRRVKSQPRSILESRGQLSSGSHSMTEPVLYGCLGFPQGYSGSSSRL